MQEAALYSTLIFIFVIVCILFESIIIYVFKIAGKGRALWQSALLNIATLGMIYVLWPLLSQMDVDADKVFPFVPILFAATVIAEALLLKLLNGAQPLKRIVLAVLSMNLVSYGTLYMILSFM